MKALNLIPICGHSISRTAFAVCGFILLANLNLMATTYYSQGSLDATQTGSWNSDVGGTGSTPGGFTTSGDVFIIQNGHTMTMSGSWEVANLTISSGGGLTMTQDVKVDNVLDLGSYVLYTAGHSMTVGNDQGTVGSISRTTGYVNGTLRIGISGSDITYPVGTGNGYSPITLSFPNGIVTSDYLSVNVVQATEPHVGDTTYVLARYWHIDAGGNLNINNPLNVLLTYLDLDFHQNITETPTIEDTLVVGEFRTNSSDWQTSPRTPQINYRSPGGNSDGGTLGATNIYNLTGDDIAIGANYAVLPVEMVAFSATAKRLSAELKWSTATEVNNFGFDIERKTQNTDWTKVGFVSGAGTSNSLHNYSFVDDNVQAGLYDYRLKQIDRDGGFKYSKTMEVEVGNMPKILSLGSNYPNPFNPTTTIEFSVPSDGKATLKVYNVLGQEVATLFDGDAVAGNLNKVKFDASRLPSGVYFSRLQSGGHALVKRMMLVK